jgi:hypothetical protein
MTRGHPLKAIVVGLACLISLAFYLRTIVPFFDFRAFYCAGYVEAGGGDPYREHPLFECEQQVQAFAVPPMRSEIAVPAPFPGFVLAFFAVLSLLGFGGALALWLCGVIAALTLATILVARTTKTPLVASASVILFPAAVVAVPLGQLTPVVLVSVAVSAWALERDWPALAALASLGALLDPPVGIALVAGLFVTVARARAPLAIGVAALVVVGLLRSGPAREVEYVWTVLPAHALANIADTTQFSVTSFLYIAGMGPAAAIRVGSACYLLSIVIGVTAAFRLRPRVGPAALVYVPCAFAVCGGTHSHMQQLAVALPAFLLVVSSLRGASREVGSAVTFVAALPWLFVVGFPLLYIPSIAVGLVYASEMMAGDNRWRFVSAIFSGLTLMKLAAHERVAHLSHVQLVVPGNPVAEVPWGRFITAIGVPTQMWYVLIRMPTILAFAVALIFISRVALAEPAARPGARQIPV